MSHPRIMIAAPQSGSGKTLLTLAMIKALQNTGKRVKSYKCGPDYIDPLFHRKVLGIPAGNLDLFFTDPATTVQLFLDGNDSDVSVIEGVMGLYDGLGGISVEASSYDLATCLQSPILLAINAKGMGRSVVALIRGFLSMDEKHLIRGVILNRIHESFYQSIKPVIEEELQIPVVGYFPESKELELDSRYLGLQLPGEVTHLEERLQKAGELLARCVDVDRVWKLCNEAPEIYRVSHSLESKVESQGHTKVRIGVAEDEAFCFYYAENRRMLERMGAEIVPFSPLRDVCLPRDLDGIILGGGYPELYADQLSGNESMRTAIRKSICSGLPSLAECGGFMYLHEQLTTKEKESFPMVGVVPGQSYYVGKLVRFGYATFTDNKEPHLTIRGHEFHYYDSDCCGNDMHATKPTGNKNWECVHVSDNHVWGYPHFYYPSNEGFVRRFLGWCREYGKKREA